MRVIAGNARHLLLKTVEGLETRPTTDRIKETLFNMINPYIHSSNFLDLYSGSGGIGIEALSRGAKKAVFVDNNKKAQECIKSNLLITKLSDKAVICTTDVMLELKELNAKGEIFDIIFMDPPYNQMHEKEVLIFLEQSNLIDKDTIIIVEASSDTEFNYLGRSNLEIYKVKEYKTNKHIYIHKKGGDETK